MSADEVLSQITAEAAKRMARIEAINGWTTTGVVTIDGEVGPETVEALKKRYAHPDPHAACWDEPPGWTPIVSTGGDLELDWVCGRTCSLPGYTGTIDWVDMCALHDAARLSPPARKTFASAELLSLLQGWEPRPFYGDVFEAAQTTDRSIYYERTRGFITVYRNDGPVLARFYSDVSPLEHVAHCLMALAGGLD